MRAYRVVIGCLTCTVSAHLRAHHHDHALHHETIKHSIRDLPIGWSELNLASRDIAAHSIELHFSLAPRDQASLEAELAETSDPDHPRWRQHLTRDQVDAFRRPKELTVRSLESFLKGHGLHNIRYSSDGTIASIKTSVQKADSMLKAKFRMFQHKSGSKVLRTRSYELPDHLAAHIRSVQPTTFFGNHLVKRKPVTAPPIRELQERDLAPVSTEYPESCRNLSSVPWDCLRRVYQTDDYIVKRPGTNAVGIVAFLNETALHSDAVLLANLERPSAAGYAARFSVEAWGGASDEQVLNKATLEAEDDQEGNMDAQTVLMMTHPLQFNFYTVGGRGLWKPDANENTNGNEPYQIALAHLLALPDDQLPRVLSFSYADDEQATPRGYAAATCEQFGALAARGVSIFFSAGDGGTAGAATNCEINDGSRREAILATFPATCPYVTVVGGLFNFPEEMATVYRSGYYSSGGISNYFQRPSWQQAVVAKYLASPFVDIKARQMIQAGATGRAFPDISAHGSRHDFFWNGTLHHYGGTSAAAPLAASVFALVNDALAAKNEPSLGFLNPLIYSGKITQGFYDVVRGNTKGCGTLGFSASPGFDLASGWGSPRFRPLLEAVWAVVRP